MEEAKVSELDELEGEIETNQCKSRERKVRKSNRNKDLLQDDYTEEHHFNPFLPSSSNSSQIFSNSSVSKPQFRSEVSRAKWIDEIGMGEIIEKKGSIWTNTGIIRNSKLYCHIEEIGFLAERGALILLDERDNLLKLEDIYAKLAKGLFGCTFESFEAYRHLKSLGYVIVRHGLSWSKKEENRNPNSNSPPETEETNPDLISERIKELQIGAIKPSFDIYLPNSKFRKTNPGNPNFILCLVREPPCRKEAEEVEKICNLVPLKYFYVDHGFVSFFAFSKASLPVLP
ncbi:hypothetical protein LUZ60_015726 [Juncus effusus]|nr:hypothetical protein LUZ60_015726 [Juncus effusus]